VEIIKYGVPGIARYKEQLLFLMCRERNSLQRQICGTIIVRKIKDLTAFSYTHMSH
jgi:hypothetical protein